MKKLLLKIATLVAIVVLMAICLTSCNKRSEETIDGCEYIVSQSYNGHGFTEAMTHKGNCKNPIHRQKIDTPKPVVIDTPTVEYFDLSRLE